MVMPAALFAAGIMVCCEFPSSLSWLFWGLAALASLLAVIICRRQTGLQSAFLLLAAFSIGGLRMAVEGGNEAGLAYQKPSVPLRDAIVERMNDLFADVEASDEGSVVVAMSMGERRDIDRDLRADYASSGAAHVLAVSGLHIGIVFFFFKLLIPRRRTARLSVWHLTGEAMLIAGIWCYVLLVGMPPSAVRAATMVSLYELMSLQNRDKMSLNVIAATAFFMLLYRPSDIYSIGFQLSFAAVISIILNYNALHSLLPKPSNPLVKALWSMFCVSISAQVGVVPLIAYHFGYVSVYGVFSSLLVIPCAWLIVNLSVLLILFLKVTAIARLIAIPLSLTAGFMNRFVEWLSGLPGATIEGIELNGFQVVSLYLALGCGCMLLRRLTLNTVRGTRSEK